MLGEPRAMLPEALYDVASKRDAMPASELASQQMHFVRYNGEGLAPGYWEQDQSRTASKPDALPSRVSLHIIQAPAEWAFPLRTDKYIKPPFVVRLEVLHKHSADIPVLLQVLLLTQAEAENMSSWDVTAAIADSKSTTDGETATFSRLPQGLPLTLLRGTLQHSQVVKARMANHDSPNAGTHSLGQPMSQQQQRFPRPACNHGPDPNSMRHISSRLGLSTEPLSSGAKANATTPTSTSTVSLPDSSGPLACPGKNVFTYPYSSCAAPEAAREPNLPPLPQEGGAQIPRVRTACSIATQAHNPHGLHPGQASPASPDCVDPCGDSSKECSTASPLATTCSGAEEPESAEGTAFRPQLACLQGDEGNHHELGAQGTQLPMQPGVCGGAQTLSGIPPARLLAHIGSRLSDPCRDLPRSSSTGNPANTLSPMAPGVGLAPGCEEGEADILPGRPDQGQARRARSKTTYQDFQFGDLRFSRPSRMKPVYIAFAAHLTATSELLVTLFKLPTISTCRAEQWSAACYKLGLPATLPPAQPSRHPTPSKSVSTPTNTFNPTPTPSMSPEPSSYNQSQSMPVQQLGRLSAAPAGHRPSCDSPGPTSPCLIQSDPLQRQVGPASSSVSPPATANGHQNSAGLPPSCHVAPSMSHGSSGAANAMAVARTSMPDPGPQPGKEPLWGHMPSLVVKGYTTAAAVLGWCCESYESTGLRRQLLDADMQALLTMAGLPRTSPSSAFTPVQGDPASLAVFQRHFAGILRVLRATSNLWNACQPTLVGGFEVHREAAVRALAGQPAGTFLIRLSMTHPEGGLAVALKQTSAAGTRDPLAVPAGTSATTSSGDVLHVLIKPQELGDRSRVATMLRDLPGATHLLDVYTSKRIDKRKVFPSSYMHLRQLQTLMPSCSGLAPPSPPSHTQEHLQAEWDSGQAAATPAHVQAPPWHENAAVDASLPAVLAHSQAYAHSQQAHHNSCHQPQGQLQLPQQVWLDQAATGLTGTADTAGAWASSQASAHPAMSQQPQSSRQSQRQGASLTGHCLMGPSGQPFTSTSTGARGSETSYAGPPHPLQHMHSDARWHGGVGDNPTGLPTTAALAAVSCHSPAAFFHGVPPSTPGHHPSPGYPAALSPAAMHSLPTPAGLTSPPTRARTSSTNPHSGKSAGGVTARIMALPLRAFAEGLLGPGSKKRVSTQGRQSSGCSDTAQPTVSGMGVVMAGEASHQHPRLVSMEAPAGCHGVQLPGQEQQQRQTPADAPQLHAPQAMVWQGPAAHCMSPTASLQMDPKDLRQAFSAATGTAAGYPQPLLALGQLGSQAPPACEQLATDLIFTPGVGAHHTDALFNMDEMSMLAMMDNLLDH
ncbi:hypothetical protein QJQ45_010408 [Haematococcus lacustris]|nr:hypothetical protein QJQ45_010408 [Haematococcus lacustris]